VIKIESFSLDASKVRENALIRATWEVDRLGYEYFIILAENNNASQSMHTRPGYPNTYNIDGTNYTIYTPGSFRTGGYSVAMIILCCSTEDLNGLDNDVPIFSVSSRLSQAQQIIMKEKGPGVYFDWGFSFGGGNLNSNNEINLITDNLFAFNYPMKIGYGPFGNIPIYALCELSFSLNNYDGFGMSFFLGAGVLYYPIRSIQLGFSLGPFFPFNFNETDTGFSYNISATYDLNIKTNQPHHPGNAGLLIGVQYSWARSNYSISSYSTSRENENGIMTFSYLSFIIKLALRGKIPSQW